MALLVGGEKIRDLPEFTLTLRIVCEECNNGWLHDLERAFRALMLWPMHGFALTLDRFGQRLVSVWAVKTGLFLNRALARGGGGEPITPPDAFFHWLRERSRPPPDTQVWIGAIDGVGSQTVSIVATQLVGHPPNPPIGVAYIFTIGNLLFFVYLPIYASERPEEQVTGLGIGGQLASRLIPIWPYKIDEVRWPPPDILTVEEFHELWPDGGHIAPGSPPK